MPTTVTAVLVVLAGLFAAGAVAASPDRPEIAVVLVGGLVAFCVALTNPLLMVSLGVLAIPFEGYFPGLVGPSQVILGLGAVAWVVRWATRPPLTLPRHPALVAFATLMVVVSAGIIFAPEPFIVARQAVTWGALLIIAVAIAHSSDTRQLHQILLAIAVSGGLAGVIAIVDPQPLTGVVFLSSDVSRATGGLGSPNALGTLLGLAIPIQMAFALRGPTTAIRLVAAACAALALFGMTLAVSRGAFIGLGAAMLVLVLWAPFRRAAAVVLPLLLVLALVGNNPASPIGQKVVERVTEVKATGSSNPRLDLWRKTPEIIRDHPLFGIGALEFTYYAGPYDLRTSEGIPNHAHSLLLTMAAELGLLGLVAFLALYGGVTAAIRRAVRRASGLTLGLSFALAASFAGFFVNGVLDYALGAAPIAAAFFVLVGCAVGLARRTEAGPPRDRSSTA